MLLNVVLVCRPRKHVRLVLTLLAGWLGRWYNLEVREVSEAFEVYEVLKVFEGFEVRKEDRLYSLWYFFVVFRVSCIVRCETDVPEVLSQKDERVAKQRKEAAKKKKKIVSGCCAVVVVECGQGSVAKRWAVG